MNLLKNTVRELALFFHLDLSKNIKYDRLTRKIMKQKLQTNSNCIDVGCHRGEILDLMIKYAPQGQHFAFEPLPHLYHKLAKSYQSKANIFPFALSTEVGEAHFQFVKNAPAYSGLKNRRYDIEKPDIEKITVMKNRLDDLIPSNHPIDFVKIDVEGGELDVLRGGVNLLKNNQPTIVFECGKGASDFYGANAHNLYDFITKEIGLQIFTLDALVKAKKALNFKEFEHFFNTNEEYYFIATKSAGELK